MAMLSNDSGKILMAGSSNALDQISATLTNPSAFGFQIYSASGFNVLSIAARVATRPNPTLKLGPVGLSCLFIIVDALHQPRENRSADCIGFSSLACQTTFYEFDLPWVEGTRELWHESTVESVHCTTRRRRGPV